MKTNYVLIDYENVQPVTLAVLDQDHFKIIMFVGASQTKITFEVAAALQQMEARAEYIKVSGSGPNALDFHIAFYIGQLAARDPDAYFHIISKDTGFDPLIKHLRSKNLRACRAPDVKDMSLVKAAMTTSVSGQLPVIAADLPKPASVKPKAVQPLAPDYVPLIVANLQKHGTAKPRTIATLSNSINTLFHKALSEKQLASLIHQLLKQGIITVQDDKVCYTLPA